MPPLTWRNVDDPDLTKAARILDSAVQGFGTGFSGLSDTLTGVVDRRRRDASAQLVPMLAGIQNSSQVDSVLNRIAGQIDPRMLTPEMQAQLLSQRGQTAEVDRTRATTGAIQGGELRDQTAFDREVLRQNQAGQAARQWAQTQGGSQVGVPRGEHASYLRQGLVDRGLPEHVADGFLINFQDESGLDPNAVGDNGNAFGLAQWNGPRMRALQAYAESVGGRPSDPDIQMDFLVQELQNSESGAWDRISQTTDAGSAAAAIVNHYERPAEEHRSRREAAYLGGNLDLSGMLGDDNLLTFNDLNPMYEDVYDDNRTVINDQRTDRNNAINDRQALLDQERANRNNALADQDAALARSDTAAGRAATEEAALLAEEASTWYNENRDGFGMGADGEEQIIEDILADDSLSPEVAAARVDAVREGYKATPEYFDSDGQRANPYLDRAIGTAESAATADLAQREVLLSDDTKMVMSMLESVGGAEGFDEQTYLDTVRTNLGEDEAEVATSTLRLNDIVNSVFSDLDGAVPKSVIYAAVETAVQAGGGWNPFMANENYVVEDELKSLLEGITSPTAFREAQLQYDQLNRSREDIAAIRAEYTKAGEEAMFAEERGGPEAAARVDAALARQVELTKQMELLSGSTGMAAQPKGERALLNGVPTGGATATRPVGGPLAPVASLPATAQAPVPVTSQEVDVTAQAIDRVLEQVDVEKTPTGAQDPDLAAEAEAWLQTEQAAAFFASNPMAFDLMQQDPVAFYVQMLGPEEMAARQNRRAQNEPSEPATLPPVNSRDRMFINGNRQQ